MDRRQEVADLTRLLDRGPPNLVRVYGRRRIGKTALLRELLRQRGGLYLVADQGEPPVQLRLLAEQLGRARGEAPPTFLGWDDLFDAIERWGRPLTVIDEFPFLLESDRSLGTRLQHRWDQRWQRGGPNLVLCGSSVGMMGRLSTSRTGPLFGRLTGDLKVRNLPYSAIRQLYPHLPEEDRIARFAVFGSSPFNHGKGTARALPEAIVDAFLTSTSRLRNEPALLLAEELRRPAKYQAILEALGAGARSVPDIEHALGSRPGSLSRYLQVLHEDLDLLRPSQPVGGPARRGRFEFSDPFFAFYYRFLPGVRDLVELDRGDEALGAIQRDLNGHIGRVFEVVAREALLASFGKEVAGRRAEIRRAGSWWNRAGEEIDIVAEGGEEIWAGEVEYSKRPSSRGLVDHLLRKVRLIERVGRRRIVPFVISRAGVDPGAKDRLAEVGGFALDLRDVTSLLEGNPA